MSARRLVSLAIPALVGLLTLSGCALHFSGEGAIKSFAPVPPGQKATFAFVFDATKKKLQGNFEDRAAGIKFRVDGLVSYRDEAGYDNCMRAIGRYRSKVRGKPGGGTVEIGACDGGVTQDGKDQLAV